MRIVGVLLAAGNSSRFGGDKLRHPVPDALQRGVALGVLACRGLVAAVPESVAVVRAGDVALAAMLREAGARVVECHDAAAGMGRSLACAIGATRDADGWVVALADMPWVRVTTIRAVADALRAGAAIAAPACDGRRGNPVGFARAYGAALEHLAGDRGARDLVAAAGHALSIIDTDDEGVLRDVDVRADLPGPAADPSTRG